LPLEDSAQLRKNLVNIFPGLLIENEVPTPSYQRLVYFCHFRNDQSLFTDEGLFELQSGWADWGSTVLKVSADIHPSVIARLEKEIEILNSLESKYYPKLYYYDVFSEDPVTEVQFPFRLFVTVEERIMGEPLSACKDRFQEEAAVLGLLLELVDGLRQLWEHPQSIVHRDLKPDNILISPDNDVTIIDLGIIREEGSAGVTATEQSFGPCSPAYASPEQTNNSKRLINFKSDFFSLGTICYELLANANPFWCSKDEPRELVFHRVQNEDPPTLKSLDLVSDGCSDLIEQLMSKEQFRRHRTIDALRTQVVSLLGEPV